MDVLKRINELRIAKRWSIYRLSVEADLPQSTITNMISRETLPSISTLEAICKALGISLSEFFQEEKEDECADYDELEKYFNQLPAETKKTVFNLIKSISESR